MLAIRAKTRSCRRRDVGQISILRIEIDGHFHGSSNVPRPWVALIKGPCPRYGLEREFMQPMNDWAEAHRAWSGNLYGIVATFALRDGLYEVSRCRGKPTKRRVVREFVAVAHGKRETIETAEALARVDGGGQAALITIPEDPDGTSWVARLGGLGTPERLGFVVREDRRLYRLRPGVYEVVERGRRGFVGVRVDALTYLSEQEAWQWLTANAHSA